MLLPMLSGKVFVVLLSPIMIFSWFFFPRRWLLVWPYWFGVLFLF